MSQRERERERQRERQRERDRDRDRERVKNGLCLGRSPGLVVIGDDSCSKGHGFESQCRILDLHLDVFHIDLLKKLYCLVEKTENKQKDAEVGL